MIPPGFEPGTACVLDRSDNQLHHRTIGVKFGFHLTKNSQQATCGPRGFTIVLPIAARNAELPTSAIYS